MRYQFRTTLAGALMLTASSAYPANLVYEYSGMGTISTFGSNLNPIADLLGIERNSTTLIPIDAKFIINNAIAPHIQNGSVANGGEFFYWDAVISTSFTLNDTCFGTQRQPKSVQTPAPMTADEAEIKISYFPTSLDAFELSMKGRANLDNPELFTTYTVPVGEVVNGQLITDAEVFINIAEFNALGLDILDSEQIPQTSDFLDNATNAIIGFQLAAIADTGTSSGAANVSISPANITNFSVTVDPAPPTPDIKINAGDTPITLAEGNSGIIAIALQSGFMEKMCAGADWWLVMSTPSGWSYFDLASGAWVDVGPSPFDLVPTYQGPFFDLPSYDIHNTAGFAPGRYTLFFGLDTEMNGTLDLEPIYFDAIELTVQ